ncbi:AAA family ATPase, partial [Pseudomonas aeruginosa]|uniref:AAA family ATPase n=1 Tax=Pseudomonas aeruginosa TaxID=287 RepID=UPI0035BE2CC2
MPAFFVTGTDTEIGKTTIAAGLLHAARRHGHQLPAFTRRRYSPPPKTGTTPPLFPPPPGPPPPPP